MTTHTHTHTHTRARARADVDDASHVGSANFTLRFYAVPAAISGRATRESLYRKYFEFKRQVVYSAVFYASGGCYLLAV